MFYKSVAFDVKANTSNRTFEGYASKFGNLDLHDDIIEQGAFAKTISERFPKKAIKVFWQHVEPIGIPTVLQEDEDGLYVEGKLSKTRLADEAIELMNDEVVDGMSIGYDIVKDEEGENGVRHLKELKLYEVSIVTWGANPEAMVTGVKSLDAIHEILKSDNIKRLGELEKMLQRLNESVNGGVFGIKDGKLQVDPNELKVGRAISRKNEENLVQAINLIQSVLDTSEIVDREDVNDDVDDDLDDDDVVLTNSKLLQSDDFRSVLKEIRSYARR